MTGLNFPRFTGRALCAEVDSDIFFPAKGDSSMPAKSVCQSCEIRAECLAWALENGEEHGVWGGLSPDERRRLRGAA